MDILSNYPIIAQIMRSDWDRNPTAYNAHDDDFYKKASESRAQLISRLEILLFKQGATRPCDREELESILYNLEEATNDMENTTGNYEFVRGFKICAKMFFEMLG